MLYVVRCPKCKNLMKTDPKVPATKAIKKCVYCGHSFKLHINLKDSRIIKKV